MKSAAKWAPAWLPPFLFIRDFLALQYIFSFEPGITDRAVRIGYSMMVPGSLYGEFPIVLCADVAFGIGAGLVIWIASHHNFPIIFPFVVCLSNLVTLGMQLACADQSLWIKK